MTYRSTLVLASLALSVLLGLTLGRGRETSGKSAQLNPTSQRVHIGLSLDTLKEARWASDRDAFVKRARELGAQVTVLSANSDDTRQIADVETLLTSQVDVIVIVPHDGAAMAKGVRLAHARGVPVIAYDRLIKDSELDLYVTFDNKRVGELQASYLLEHAESRHGDKVRVVRIYGSKSDNNAFLFKAGQDQLMLEAIRTGKVEVIHEDWAEDWKPENAKRILNAALTKHGGTIDAVLASNDGTAGGAIQALREEGLAGQVLVTGQDADLAACQRIARGEQAVTIFKPLKSLAYGAAELATRMAQGRPIIAKHETANGKIQVPSVFYDVVAVTQENLKETVIATGFHTLDAVYPKGEAAETPTGAPGESSTD